MKSRNQSGQGWFSYSGFAPLVHPLDERISRQRERGNGKCVGDSNRVSHWGISHPCPACESGVAVLPDGHHFPTQFRTRAGFLEGLGDGERSILIKSGGDKGGRAH